MKEKSVSLLLLFVSLVLVVVMAVVALVIVPVFQDVYVKFGANLPLVTKILFATFRWWGIAAVVPFAVWAWWPNRSISGVVALVFGIALGQFLLLFCLYGCYAPVFQLTPISH
jgi:hypothetical protein